MTIAEDKLKEIVWRIHVIPELSGIIIGYYGDSGCRIIGFPSCVTPNSENVAVIVEEVSVPAGIRGARDKQAPVNHKEVQQIVKHRSRLGPELVGAGIACTMTVASVLGVAGGVATELPTGGASSLLIAASWTGLVTGGIQCANGIVRVGAAFAEVDLDAWDRNQAYSVAILVTDALGVASAVGSLPYAIRNLWAVISRGRAFKAANLSFEALRRMNRLERLRVLSKVFAEASRSDEGVVALVTAAKEAQIGARTMQRTSGLSVNHAATLRRIIKDETVRRLEASLVDVFSNLAGLAANAAPASLVGSASGTLNVVINLLDGGQPII